MTALKAISAEKACVRFTCISLARVARPILQKERRPKSQGGDANTENTNTLEQSKRTVSAKLKTNKQKSPRAGDPSLDGKSRRSSGRKTKLDQFHRGQRSKKKQDEQKALNKMIEINQYENINKLNSLVKTQPDMFKTKQANWKNL